MEIETPKSAATRLSGSPPVSRHSRSRAENVATTGTCTGVRTNLLPVPCLTMVRLIFYLAPVRKQKVQPISLAYYAALTTMRTLYGPR